MRELDKPNQQEVMAVKQLETHWDDATGTGAAAAWLMILPVVDFCLFTSLAVASLAEGIEGFQFYGRGGRCRN